jgi:hypothetical protein
MSSVKGKRLAGYCKLAVCKPLMLLFGGLLFFE